MELTYFHIELRPHNLLLANGAKADSLLDKTGFPGQFNNAAGFAATYLDAPPLPPTQAWLEGGSALQYINERVAAQVGITRQVEPAGTLHGYLDRAGRKRVRGWAQDVDGPEAPFALDISVGGAPVMHRLANADWKHLRKAGRASGCHAFDISLPQDVNGRVVARRVTGWIGPGPPSPPLGPGQEPRIRPIVRV